MTNKVALVTGGTDGVGLSIAGAMAKDGYDVHVLGSNAEKGARVQMEFANEAGSLTFWQVDLADLDAVKEFSNRFLQQHKHLDRLVFSAGVLLPRRAESKQGYELTLAINYLSAYVLARRLKPLLQASNKPRVLLVSGGGGIVLRKLLDFDNLQLSHAYNAAKAAARAVHAKTVLAQILAKEWQDDGISVNTFHPGIVKGSLGRNLPWPLSSGFKVASMFMPSECVTGIELALSESYEGLSGNFVEGKKRRQLAFDADYCGRLLKATDALVKEYIH